MRTPVRSVAAVLALASALAVADRAPAHGDLHRQIIALDALIAAEPASAALHVRRGDLHRAHRDWPAALADYERAATLDPGLSAADRGRAAVLLETGDPGAALASADRALARGAGRAEAGALRARALGGLGRPREAADEWAGVIQATARPRPELYIERARALVADAGRLEEAIAVIDQGIARLGPVVALDLFAIDLELGRCQPDAAVARVDRQAAATSRKETWLVRRGEILEGAGRRAEAREAFAAALTALSSLASAHRNTRAMEEVRQRSAAGLERLGDP